MIREMSQNLFSAYSQQCEVDWKSRDCALRIVPRADKLLFAFTAPLGLVNPMACIHVRLLGPCFKTGRRGRRPTRQRDENRNRALLAIRVLSVTRQAQSQTVPAVNCRENAPRSQTGQNADQTPWPPDTEADFPTETSRTPPSKSMFMCPAVHTVSQS